MCSVRTFGESAGWIVEVYGVIQDIAVTVPTTWNGGVSKSAAVCPIRIRTQEPTQRIRVISVLRVIEPGSGIPIVGGELVPILRGRGRLLLAVRELARPSGAVRS